MLFHCHSINFSAFSCEIMNAFPGVARPLDQKNSNQDCVKRYQPYERVFWRCPAFFLHITSLITLSVVPDMVSCTGVSFIYCLLVSFCACARVCVLLASSSLPPSLPFRLLSLLPSLPFLLRQPGMVEPLPPAVPKRRKIESKIEKPT